MIARYFFLECDRFLRYTVTPAPDRKAAGLPSPDFDRRPLMEDVLESGLAWEEEVVSRILGGKVSVAPGPCRLCERRFTEEQTLYLLRTERPRRYVYQATLRAPDA